MDELIAKVRKILEKKESADEIPLFTKRGFEGVKISTSYFKALKPSKEKPRVIFIDGGNAELVESNNFSLQIIRVGAVCYQDNKKVFFEKREFYCMITFENNQFKVETAPEKISLKFNLDDESLKDGRAIAKISKIGGFVRRVLELELACEMIEKADYIILDGSLEEKFTYERKHLLELYKKSKEKNVCIIGFCKTNSLITKNGRPVSTILLGKKEGAWYYNPVANIRSEEFLGDICFAKLNEKSSHAFRVDVYNADFEKTFGNIYNFCKDPVFIGYPYGLIEADRIARITNKEKEYEKTKLMVKLGKDWEKIKKLQSTTDAHQILDSIG
ncbi:MAG: DNA double-strand break repair nuclease NurA [Nanoarchaeota archaeon]|nr:DNA double-strand break repair nuclease NurA [Nanoarchaeota archaeon]MBU1269568.1 DNA double-strand break repair nuclease NurA [Nanoarchaeota archaeon]MBU1604700.1 DNA double-strand break repair nuclease NurA [Nanoarchaeota archaeon]MBU2443829.1 DNA double-strand break repair nuclease NurA [Nanoarchaeota archaeon]